MRVMKSEKQSKKILNIICVIITFVFTFSQIAVSGIQDEKLFQNTNRDEIQADSNEEARIIETTGGDAFLNTGITQQADTMTPIDNAAAIAVGYIGVGKTKEEIITILTGELNYTVTEAEIAYSKADAKLQTENTPNDAEHEGLTPVAVGLAEAIEEQQNTGHTGGILAAAIEDTQTEQKPTLSAKERVAQAVESRGGSLDFADGKIRK